MEEMPRAHDDGGPDALARALALLRATHVCYRRARGEMLVAAVSYFVFVALIPLSLLAVSVTAQVIGTSAAAMARVEAVVRQYLGAESDVVLVALREVIAARGLIGGVGLLLLLWSGTGAIVMLQRAINAVYGTPDRSFGAERLLAVGTLLLLGPLALVAVGLPAAIAVWHPFPGVEGVALLLSLALNTAILLFLYARFPTGGVSVRAAFVAAVVIAIAWEAAKRLYFWYAAHAEGFTAVAGALGAVIGLLLWINLSVALCVAGACLATVLERGAADGTTPA